MRLKNKIILCIAVIIIFLSLPFYANAIDEMNNDVSEYEEIMLRAEVLEVKELKNIDGTQDFFGGQDIRQLVTVRVTSDEFYGTILQVEHVIVNQPKYDIIVDVGDKVILFCVLTDGEIVNAYISDYARDTSLKYLLILFAISLIVFGGITGFKSLVSLAITGMVIICILLPVILKGYSPILSTVLACTFITAITFVLIGGLTVKTLSAFIGTVGGVVVAGVLAVVSGEAAQLTGFSEEEMYMLLFIPQGIEFDYKGLLFAGMIIGALGAVMDVSMSIASAIDEIKKINKNVSIGKLIMAGINVGKDIMGTMSNTLILAYTGSAMPLMLVFMAHDIPYLKIINLDVIATEIVRALTGSIGLIFSVPLTAVAAGIFFSICNKNLPK